MDDTSASQFTGLPTGKRAHRGRRSRGKGPKPPVSPGGTDHHDVAKGHLANAAASKDPMQTKAHLFKALTSLKKC